MLQKASSEGWKSGYKPRQKAISVHLRVPLCTHGSELPSRAALQRAPPSTGCRRRPAGLPGSPATALKTDGCEGGGEKILNADQQFSTDHLRKISVLPTSFLLLGLLVRSPATAVQGEKSGSGRRGLGRWAQMLQE